jgi:plastocyanin
MNAHLATIEINRTTPWAWGVMVFAALCLTSAGQAAAALSDAERAAVCAEAEERYRAIFGRSSKDEPVTVILMFKDTFCPPQLTVEQGARLRWINVDRRTSHSVWFKEAGKPESERTFPEEIVEMTVDLPVGEHPYLCGPHWEKEGMVGRLTVKGK